ncbi:MAG: hypothetical protein AB7G13_21350 [Lautropia sp.]
MNRPTTQDTWLHARWQRLGDHVRCALYPGDASRIRLYVQCALRLTRSADDGGVAVHLRTLQTLLRTADDETLPWFWRSVCLEHVNLPYARLASALSVHDSTAVRAIDAAIARSRDRLPALPPQQG